jgi:hypothetical protein
MLTHNPQPVLGLAVHLMEVGFEDKFLFPGQAVDDKFGSEFKRAVEAEPQRDIFKGHDLDPDDLAQHSVRKGTISETLNGVIDGPSATVVGTRVDWHLGDVPNRYIKMVTGGEQHLGRTTSGLRPDSIEFGALPPHFAELSVEEIELVNNFVLLAFPHIPLSALELGKRLLASALYHFEFLDSVLPRDHVLRSRELFTHPRPALQRLKEFVTILPSSKIPFATGTTPVYAVLRELVGVKEQMGQMEDRLTMVQAELAKLSASLGALGGLGGLDGLGLANGAASIAELLEVQRAILVIVTATHGQLLEPGAAQPQPGAPVLALPPQAHVNLPDALAVQQQQPLVATNQFGDTLYTWGGKAGRLFPEGILLPKEVDSALHLYLGGNPALGIPPLSRAVPEDFSVVLRKRVQEYRASMVRLCEEADNSGVLPPDVTCISLAEVRSIIATVFETWGIKSETECNRKRSIYTMNWRTCNNVRKKVKGVVVE